MSKARLRKKLTKVWKTFDDEWSSGKEAAKNARLYRMWDKSYDNVVSVGIQAPVKHSWCKQCAPSHPHTVHFFRFNKEVNKFEQLKQGVWTAKERNSEPKSLAGVAPGVVDVVRMA